MTIRQFNGLTEWRNDEGFLHREDGPARIYHNLKGATLSEVWYLNGIFYCRDNMPLNLYIAYCKWSYINENYAA